MKTFLTLWLSSLLFASVLKAQYTTSPRSGLSAVSSATTGSSVAWTNLSNFQAADGNMSIANVALSALSTATTNLFAATNFSFSIPATATVTGISVSLIRKAGGLGVLSDITDHRVSIIKSGTVQATDRSTGASWSASSSTVSFGGSSDTWGTTWTPAQINASNFGIAIGAKIYSGVVGLSLQAEIDYISMTVHYNDIVLPIELLSFTGEYSNNHVELVWETITESNSDYFVVERSATAMAEDWQTIDQQQAAGNSQSLLRYTSSDPSPLPQSYYRLKQIDQDLRLNYSPIIYIEDINRPGVLAVYPNPAKDHLKVSSQASIQKLEIYSSDGRLLHNYSESQSAGNVTELDISTLNPGFYWLRIYGDQNIRNERFIKEN